MGYLSIYTYNLIQCFRVAIWDDFPLPPPIDSVRYSRINSLCVYGD